MQKLPKSSRSMPNSPLTPLEPSDFKSMIGSLQWAVSQTRQELAGEVSLLQGGEPILVSAHIKAVSLMKEMIANPDEGISFHPLDLKNCVFAACGDSSWANATNHKSQSCFIIHL